MIKSFYKDDIIKHLAAVITYGTNKSYSFSAIEDLIVSSEFINKLENNDYDIDSKSSEIIKQTYKIEKLDNFDISFKGLFVAESYIKLFFDLNKSFEYLFLYFPLGHLVDTYDVYHEMGFSNLKEDFLSLTIEESLLRKLSKSKNIKLSEITRLTGISENSIKYYAISDSNLFGASFDVLYTLANLFNVKINLFIKSLAIYLDNSVYLFDKSNEDYRNYLGFYFALFYDLSLRENEFTYFNKCFVSKDVTIHVVSLKSNELDLKKINELYSENDYLVILMNGFESLTNYSFLNKTHLKEIMAITQENIYLVKKNQTKEITDTINRSLIIRAKTKINNLNNR